MGRADWGKDNGASYWRIEEYPGDRVVLELLERIFCLLWMNGKQSMGEHGLNVESGFARGG